MRAGKNSLVGRAVDDVTLNGVGTVGDNLAFLVFLVRRRQNKKRRNRMAAAPTDPPTIAPTKAEL